jgi:hypothetical protein
VGTDKIEEPCDFGYAAEDVGNPRTKKRQNSDDYNSLLHRDQCLLHQTLTFFTHQIHITPFNYITRNWPIRNPPDGGITYTRKTMLMDCGGTNSLPLVSVDVKLTAMTYLEPC